MFRFQIWFALPCNCP